MGTAFNRGTKDKPNWYVGYREHGRWVYKPSQQPTKAQAKRWVQEIESRVSRGNVGIDEPDDSPTFKTPRWPSIVFDGSLDTFLELERSHEPEI
jgi:hypothetical protein